VKQMRLDYAVKLETDMALPVEEVEQPRSRSRSRSPRRESDEEQQPPQPPAQDEPPAKVAPVGRARRGRPPFRGRAGGAGGRGGGLSPASRSVGQRRGRPTQLNGFEHLVANGDQELQSRLDDWAERFREVEEILDTGLQAMFRGSDDFAKKLLQTLDEGLQIKLVKVRRQDLRLQTPQPRAHAADARLRVVFVRTAAGVLYGLDTEDWSQQSPQQRRREVS